MNSHAVQNNFPQSIGNVHQSIHLMEAQKKKKSLMVQNHSTTNSAWLQPASTIGACFPSPVFSPFWQLIFGKCPLVPWMYSSVCAWPDILYWLSLTLALWVQSPDHRSLLCSSREPPNLSHFYYWKSSVQDGSAPTVINDSTATTTSTRWCTGKLGYLDLKSFKLLKQGTVSSHMFSGWGKEKTHHGKLQLSLCTSSRGLGVQKQPLRWAFSSSQL